jgi:hypothetical protein
MERRLGIAVFGQTDALERRDMRQSDDFVAKDAAQAEPCRQSGRLPARRIGADSASKPVPRRAGATDSLSSD